MLEGRPLRPSPTRRGWAPRGFCSTTAVNHHRCHRRGPSGAGQTCSRRDLPWACSPARIWADPSSCSRSRLQTPRSPTLPLTALGRSCRPGVQGAGAELGACSQTRGASRLCCRHLFTFPATASQEKSHVRNWRSKRYLAPLMRPHKVPRHPGLPGEEHRGFPAPLPLSPFYPPDHDRRVNSPALSGRGSRASGRTSG